MPGFAAFRDRLTQAVSRPGRRRALLSRSAAGEPGPAPARAVGSVRSKGFTAIELMATIFIMAVLTALALPDLRTFILNNRLATQDDDLVADFMFARSEAIRRASDVTICASSNGSTCTASAWNQGRIVWTTDTGVMDVLRVRAPLSGNNTLTVAGLTSPAVTYIGTGATNLGANATFKLCDWRTGNFGQTITLTPSGTSFTSPATCP